MQARRSWYYDPSHKRWYIPVFALISNWAMIIGAIAVAERFHSPVLTLAAIALIGTRQHALLILNHEAAHMNLGWNPVSNQWLSDLFCSFPILFDSQTYRYNHLKHHSHLNTDQDPDWVRKAGKPEWTFPVARARLLLFLPYFIFLKGPIEWLYICWKFSGWGERARWKRQPLFLAGKFVYFAAAGTVLITCGWTKEFLLFWMTPLLFVFPLIQRFRSVAEHFALSYGDERTSSRDVIASWWERFLFSPHNVNYHLTHHFYPHIPFYDLPRSHSILKEAELKDAYSNRSYVLPFQDSVLADLLKGPKPSLENIIRRVS